MAIASAVQHGTCVYIYDERGRQTACVLCGSQPGDGLQGYTSTTVSIRQGNCICIYDELGRQLNMMVV